MDTDHINRMHDAAMALSDAALAVERLYEISQRDSDRRTALDLFNQAAIYEDIAASWVRVQPSMAVMWRSAASLYEKAKRYGMARQCCERGLEGCPPHAIAAEIREVLERIDTATHPEG